MARADYLDIVALEHGRKGGPPVDVVAQGKGMRLGVDQTLRGQGDKNPYKGRKKKGPSKLRKHLQGPRGG